MGKSTVKRLIPSWDEFEAIVESVRMVVFSDTRLPHATNWNGPPQPGMAITDSGKLDEESEGTEGNVARCLSYRTLS